MIFNPFKVGQLVRVTPGRNHAWYRTNRGFLVRKPIGHILSTSVGWMTAALLVTGAIIIAFSVSVTLILKFAEFYH
ncbi:MAG TPA: hypothetical protein VFE87_01400 [Candidatus Paceibacterota bacterium]|nr:hypothetical protein [Candidatus Paceibacterota bacterium]